MLYFKQATRAKLNIMNIPADSCVTLGSYSASGLLPKQIEVDKAWHVSLNQLYFTVFLWCDISKHLINCSDFIAVPKSDMVF